MLEGMDETLDVSRARNVERLLQIPGDYLIAKNREIATTARVQETISQQCSFPRVCTVKTMI